MPRIPLAPKTALVVTSTDGGQNWKVIHTDNNWDNEDYNLAYSVQKSFAMDPSNAKRLLLGTNKVFECKDATVANPVWKAISGVLSPGSGVGSQYITALAVATSAAQFLYAATADGHVWTTSNDGANWNQNDTGLLGSGVGKVVDIRIDPTNAKRAFGVTNGAAGKNIWFHDPADSTWKNISGDMPWNLCGFLDSGRLAIHAERYLCWFATRRLPICRSGCALETLRQGHAKHQCQRPANATHALPDCGCDVGTRRLRDSAL